MIENFLFKKRNLIFIFLPFFFLLLNSALAVEIVVDDSDTGYSETGTWSTAINSCGYNGDFRYENVGSTQYAAWRPFFSTAGNYSVYVHYCVHSLRPDAVSYHVVHADDTTTINVDQTKDANGASVPDFTASGWKYLGRFRFNTSPDMRVYLDTSDAGVTCADAVKFTSDIHVPDDYPTIREAINAANSGDRIFVRDGTYFEEQFDIDKEIELRSNSDPTIIVNGYGINIIASNVTIDGFTITSNDTNTIGLLRVGMSTTNTHHSVTNVTIQNNYFKDFTTLHNLEHHHGVAVGSNQAISNILIKKNTFKNLTYSGTGGISPVMSGITIFKAGSLLPNDITITKNRIHDITSSGSWAIGMSIQGDTISISDNIIYDISGTAGLKGGIVIHTPSTDITNDGNEIYDCDFAGIVIGDPVTNVDIIGDEIHDNDRGVLLLGSGNQISINNNSIYDNTEGVINWGATEVDAEYNWWGSNTGPYHSINPTGLGNNVSDYVDFIPWLTFNLTLTSPEDRVYDTRRIWVNASTNLVADKIEYSLDGRRFRRLCRDCDSYSRKRTFRDSNHTLVVRATLGSETDSKTVNFFVDSREPRIRRIYPRDREHVKGIVTFTIRYTEDNLQNISLFYNASSPIEYVMTYCPSGRNKECSAEINLTEYDGKNVSYYFVVRDPVREVNSDVNTIFVDATAPTVTLYSPVNIAYPSHRILVSVGVNEEAEILESSVDGRRFRRLCRRCDSYDRPKSFTEGEHNLSVRAVDKAGNEGYAFVVFIVDSRKPRIRRIRPRGGEFVKGIANFTVEYSEDTVSNVSLFYGGSEYEYFMDYCTSGRREKCIATVDVSAFDGKEIQYYFVVRSPFYEVESRRYNVTVDNTVPIVTLYSPENKTYDSRRVRLNVSITEDVRLEYSDNDGRFRRLCSRCDSYSRRRSFRYGVHTLLIKATDKAGNEGTDTVTFTVVRGA